MTFQVKETVWQKYRGKKLQNIWGDRLPDLIEVSSQVNQRMNGEVIRKKMNTIFVGFDVKM